MGTKEEDLGNFHFDHIMPTCKEGRDDPRNYCLMPAHDNWSYAGRIPLKKCEQVGLATVTQVLEFHQQILESDSDA